MFYVGASYKFEPHLALIFCVRLKWCFQSGFRGRLNTVRIDDSWRPLLATTVEGSAVKETQNAAVDFLVAAQAWRQSSGQKYNALLEPAARLFYTWTHH